MEGFITAILDVDNAARAEAERQYDAFKLASPREVIVQLCALLKPHFGEAHRSLAAVLLRGIVVREPELWHSLSVEELGQVRRSLLESLLGEPIGHIQRKIATAVAANARISPWPELLDGIVQLTASSSIQQNELALYLLDKLAEYAAQILISSLSAVAGMIQPFLDACRNLQTRAIASQTLCSVLCELQAPNTEIQGMLPGVCFTVNALFEVGEADLLQDVLNSLSHVVKDRPQVLADSSTAQSLLQVLQLVSSDERGLVDGGVQVIALGIIVNMLTGRISGKYCSNPQSRAACSQLCMRLMTQVEEDDDTVASHNRPESEDNGFGDVDGDGEDGNVADFAAMSLDTLSKAFEPQETVQVCLTSAWSLVAQPDWRARRAALFTASIICEGAREAMYPLLGQLVPAILGLLSDPHPRVRYIAVHCLATFIAEFTGSGDDDEEEEEDEDEGQSGEGNQQEKAFQLLFPQNVPQAICQCIEANAAFPRIVYVGLSALKSYFNPDLCPEEICRPFAPSVLDFSLSLLSSPLASTPMFVKEECASVIGNVSVLYGDCLMQPDRYSPIVTVLKGIVSMSLEDFTRELSATRHSQHNHSHSLEHDVSLLKGKCLESIALVGRAVGKAVFLPVAHEVLQHFVQLQGINNSHSGMGWDYSDPLSSYMMQTTARIAGVIRDDFAPYKDHFIPSLLKRIADNLSVSVLDEAGTTVSGKGNGNDSSSSSSSSGNDQTSKEEVFSVYKRGVGQVKVVCNTHEIVEKETACRCLYQFCTDIPHLLWRDAPSIVDSVVQLYLSPLAQSEDAYLIVGAITCKAVKMFMRCASASFEGRPDGLTADEASCVQAVNSMCEKAMRGMCAALERLQGMNNSHRASGADMTEGVNLTFAMVEAFNDLCKVRYEGRRTSRRYSQWEVIVPVEVMAKIVEILRDELSSFIQMRFIEHQEPAREEDVEAEDSLWRAMIDSIGWLIKLSGDGIRDLFNAELMPLIHGLATNEHNPPLLSLLPICTLIDTIEFMPSNAAAGAALALPLLLANLSECEVTVACVYGLGVCAMHGGAAFDKSCGVAIKALLGAAGADPETAKALALPEDEVDMDMVRDNAVSSIFKIAVFQGEILGMVREQMLLFSLNSLPLREDTSEAKELHRLFVDLVASKDSRLLGPSGRMEFFPNVLRVLAELSAAASGADQHTTSSGSDGNDNEEFWEAQIVSEATLNKLKVVLRAGLGPQSGVPSAVVQSAMSSMSKAARAEIAKYIS